MSDLREAVARAMCFAQAPCSTCASTGDCQHTETAMWCYADQADAALAAIEAAGWQCVPREPTVQMFGAAGASSGGVTPRGGIDWLGRMLPKYWQAMLAAAPKP